MNRRPGLLPSFCPTFCLAIGLTIGVLGLLALPWASEAWSQERLTRQGHDDLLSQARGSVLVVNYWATWCGPCLAEMPMLKTMRQAYPPEEMTLLAISFDYDAQAHARLVERLGLNFPSYLAQENLMHDLGISVIPRMDFYDPTGRLVRSHEGLLSPEEFHALVREAAGG